MFFDITSGVLYVYCKAGTTECSRQAGSSWRTETLIEESDRMPPSDATLDAKGRKGGEMNNDAYCTCGSRIGPASIAPFVLEIKGPCGL